MLLAAAIVALVWANSPWHDSYHHVWELELTLSTHQLARPRLDQRCPDGDLLLSRGHGDQARDRPRRTGGHSQGSAAHRRRAGRNDRAGAVVSRVQLRPSRPAWLGRPHGDRHRVLARRARDGEGYSLGVEGLPADPGDCRRHRRHHGHRVLLHGRPACKGAVRRRILPADDVHSRSHRRYAHDALRRAGHLFWARFFARESMPPSPASSSGSWFPPRPGCRWTNSRRSAST